MRTRLLVPVALLCVAASVPASVAKRPLTTGADPIGTWTLDGEGTQLTIGPPRDNGQLYDIVFGGTENMGKGLSDGDWVYIAYPLLPGQKIGLGAFGPGETGTEGVIGLYKLNWEVWTSKLPITGFPGSYVSKGVTASGSKISIDLGVQPAATASDAFDLVWQGDTNRFEGIGLVADTKMAVARWGVTVTTTDFGASTTGGLVLTKSTDQRDRPTINLGAFKITGDRLEGRVLNGDTMTTAAHTFAKAK